MYATVTSTNLGMGCEMQVCELVDGQRFSVDGGRTWHVCAVVLFGSVAVYVDGKRDEAAMTVRVPAARDAECLVEE